MKKYLAYMLILASLLAVKAYQKPSAHSGGQRACYLLNGRSWCE